VTTTESAPEPPEPAEPNRETHAPAPHAAPAAPSEPVHAHAEPAPAAPANAPAPAHEHGHEKHEHGHGHEKHEHGHGHERHEHGHGHEKHGHEKHGHEKHGHEKHGHEKQGHHAEHAFSLGKKVGLTMAVLGVLLAFGSAKVGGERNEFVATLIEHTNAAGRHQSIATKYRVLQSQLQQLHSMMPRAEDFARNEAELDRAQAELERLTAAGQLEARSGAAIQALRLETKKIIDTVAPTRSDLMRFVVLVRKYAKEREAADKLAESYEDLIQVHQSASERSELATLATEIAIVLASISLLLQSRRAWHASIFLGVVAIAILLATGAAYHYRLGDAEAKVTTARSDFAAVSSDEAEQREDEKLLKDITGEETATAPSEGH
jgi:hypothetical protein